jgi:hypothetical protein
VSYGPRPPFGAYPLPMGQIKTEGAQQRRFLQTGKGLSPNISHEGLSKKALSLSTESARRPAVLGGPPRLNGHPMGLFEF